MRNEKITPLSERLSRDDELQGDSNSIVHQEFLSLLLFIFIHVAVTLLTKL